MDGTQPGDRSQIAPIEPDGEAARRFEAGESVVEGRLKGQPAEVFCPCRLRRRRRWLSEIRQPHRRGGVLHGQDLRTCKAALERARADLGLPPFGPDELQGNIRRLRAVPLANAVKRARLTVALAAGITERQLRDDRLCR